MISGWILKNEAEKKKFERERQADEISLNRDDVQKFLELQPSFNRCIAIDNNIFVFLFF